MKKAILAKKIGMTQVFIENGVLVPVTVLLAGPCTVVQKKTVETDGYNSVQVGFEDAKLKQVNKPKKGHFKNVTVVKKYLKEFRLEDISGLELGSEIKADVFVEGEKVDVSGVSKGKGFQGSIKRHGQRTGPVSHGSKYHRGSGSLGASTTPGKVRKNKKLPGHMGAVQRTVQNLEIVKIDSDKNLILVKGSVPGPKGTLLTIKNTVKM